MIFKALFLIERWIVIKIAKITSSFIRFINFCIHAMTFLSLLFIAGIYFADIYFADGYYSSYALNFLINNELMNVFFEISKGLSTNPYRTIAFFGLTLFLIFRLKRVARNITIRKYNINNPIANIMYLCFCVFINVFVIIVGSSFLLNVVITTYVDSSYDEKTEGIFYSYEEKVGKIREEISENSNLAKLAINKIIYDVETDGYLESLDSDEFYNLCLKVNEIMDLQDGPKSQSEHYLRNYLNRAPENLEDMLKEISEGNEKNWTLLSPENSMLHMFGENGEFNLKFVSGDGIFEAVYNSAGILLTEDNDPVNMGTYNYASPVTMAKKHSTYDVAPYYIWGNTENDTPKLDAEALENFDKFQTNQMAVARYHDIERILT